MAEQTEPLDFADRIGLKRGGPITQQEIDAIHEWRDEALARIDIAKKHVDEAIEKSRAGASAEDVLASMEAANDAMRSKGGTT